MEDKKLYYLAACDSEGICYGILRGDGSVSGTPDNEIGLLMEFDKRSDAALKAAQINLGHVLLPDGAPYRVAVVSA